MPDKNKKNGLKQFEIMEVDNVISATIDNLRNCGVRVSRKELLNILFIEQINNIGVVGIGRILENQRVNIKPEELSDISQSVILEG
jgi:hypothetical protein